MNGYGTPASTNSASTLLDASFSTHLPFPSKPTPKCACVSVHKETTLGTTISFISTNVYFILQSCSPPCNSDMIGPTSFNYTATSHPLRLSLFSPKIQRLIFARSFLPSLKCMHFPSQVPPFACNPTCRYSNGYNLYLLTPHSPTTIRSGRLTDHNVPFSPLLYWTSITQISNLTHQPHFTQSDHVAPVFHFVTTTKALILLSVKTLQINQAIISL